MIHSFNPVTPAQGPGQAQAEGENKSSAYGSNLVAEALLADPDLGSGDIFYTFSGIHGVAGTWGVYSLDLSNFSPSSSSRPQNDAIVKVEKVADVQDAMWLNGGTVIPRSASAQGPLLLIAESLQGILLCCEVRTGKVGTWLKHEWLGKVTGRPPWPGVNGVQYFRGHVFMTSSDRGIVLRAEVDEETGKYVEGSLEVLEENVTGDDLCFDQRGNAYVTTNPAQTVIKFAGLGARGFGRDGEGRIEEEGKEEGNGRVAILGGENVAETAGPTAVAFGRMQEDMESIYVTTTGGMVKPVGGVLVEARVVRVDVGVRGEGV